MNKTHPMMVALLSVSIFVGPAALARGKGPCRELRKRCEAAGYVVGGHKDGNNGVWVDCVDKILSGVATSKPVDLSGVSEADKSACKAKLDAKKAERKAAKAAQKSKPE